MISRLQSMLDVNLKKAATLASCGVMISIGMQAPQAHGQLLPKHRVPSGWVEEPEIVYPSVYQRLVQPSPTVQRLYMWPTREFYGHGGHKSSHGNCNCNSCSHHMSYPSTEIQHFTSSDAPESTNAHAVASRKVVAQHPNHTPRVEASPQIPSPTNPLAPAPVVNHIPVPQQVSTDPLPPVRVEQPQLNSSRKMFTLEPQSGARPLSEQVSADRLVSANTSTNPPITVAKLPDPIVSQPAAPITDIFPLQDPLTPELEEEERQFGLFTSQTQPPLSAGSASDNQANQPPATPAPSALTQPPSTRPQANPPAVGIPTPPTSPNPTVGTTPGRQLDLGLASADTALRSVAARRSLARTPSMFGDFFGPTFVFPLGDPTITQTSASPGGGISKISDNNRAGTGCRCYFTYNHFHNAIDSVLDVGTIERRSANIDRFTLGIERRVFRRNWSVEVRMPFFAEPEIPFSGISGFNAGNIGNLAAIFKNEIYRTDDLIMSIGLGCSLPTGDDIVSQGLGGDVLTIRNDAVHLLPFFATQRVWNRAFFHSFIQVDTVLNSNRVEAVGFLSDSALLTDQSLLFVDIGTGYWLYQNPNAKHLTGLAALFEVHYETALQDADILTVDAGRGDITVGNVINRFDVINLTTAMQADIGPRSSVRVGASFPITPDDDRFFDFELGVQLVHYTY